MRSNMARLIHFCVFLGALWSCVQGTTFINNQYFALLGPGLTDSPLLTDCPVEDNGKIIQAYHDALNLAGEARDQLRLGGPNRARQITRFFDKVFTDGTGRRSSTQAIADQFNGIATENVLPSVLIFHCAVNWKLNLNARKSNLDLFDTRSDCSGRTTAVTTVIRSGRFGSKGDQDPDYGANGAFRSGTHIMLCPSFFSLPPLSDITTPVATSILDRRLNQGMVVLHELMHASSEAIDDGGYGYGGVVDVANGMPPKGNGIVPETNADTFALFAMVCTATKGMRNFDWTTGMAQAPQ
ncbi:hypothetical protein F4808DRAFT_474345 [Astrocystis sublimbata]|nr:hypothetical protein F4808DRAFT_474345 [Astrocystis sublimbata]